MDISNSPTPSTKRPTILDVARTAGVSHQTVSRYLRFNGGLKPATSERIKQAIDDLDYRPNLVARSMRTRRTGRLGVIVPLLAFNPARMLAGASAAAHEAGYAVDVLSFEGTPQTRASRLLEIIDSGQVEGVLSFVPLPPAVEDRLSSDVTMVISADFDEEMRTIGELADASALRELILRLARMGHTRFFHIAGARTFASARARRQMYLDTLAELGFESTGIHDGDWSGQSGIAGVLGIDESNRPTAIIAANDLVAAGAMKAAIDRGWRVPEDVSITGWDDDPTSAFLRPSLTTIAIDLEAVGRGAMQRLIHQLEGKPDSGRGGQFTRLIWRDSTGPAPTR